MKKISIPVSELRILWADIYSRTLAQGYNAVLATNGANRAMEDFVKTINKIVEEESA